MRYVVHGPATELSSLTEAVLLDDAFEYPTQEAALYGRSSETLILLKAFQRMMCSKKSEIVLVHGDSGSGKTSLVDILRSPVCDNRGYFCVGKYFQNSVLQEPYSAIMAAFSDLCDLVSQSNDSERKNRIREDLRNDGCILAKSMSSLSPFLLQSECEDGTQEEAVINCHDSSYSRFKAACKRFLQAMSCDNHPIVLFFDDIQWMDEGSRLLLDMLLHEDTELRNVMIIMSYREEEAEKTVELLREGTLNRAVNIQVPNLDLRAVHHMVSAAFESSSQKTLELSNLILKKTLGNPFYVKQFMLTLKQNGLAVLQRNSWSFDVKLIQREVGVSKSLAQMLSRNIERLPATAQAILQVASVLGYRFSLSVLTQVMVSISRSDQVSKKQLILTSGPLGATRSTDETVALSLSQAVDQGFIEAVDDLTFQFSHDKVQASFQALINKEKGEWLHLNIGQTFLGFGDAESMYRAAVHFDRASGLIKSQPQLFKTARVKLEAAKFCADKSAFIDAANFLLTGLKLLPADKWSRHFDLTFEMSELLAKMHLIIGNLAACQERTNEALQFAKSTEMKANLLLIDVEARMAAHEVGDSIAAATRGLKVLGIDLPRKVTLCHIIFKFCKIRRLVRRMTNEEILALPPMKGRACAATVKLLRHVCTYSLTMDDKLLTMYVSLLATEVTLKGGLSPFSANALVMYAVIELAIGNRSRAYRFGKLALQLQEQIKCRETESSTIGSVVALVTHWKDPLREVVESLENGTKAGFDAGDILSAVHCLTSVLLARLFIGSNLSSLEKYMRIQYQRCCGDVGEDPRLLWVQPPMQYILNLQNLPTDWKEATVLTGEIMNEVNFRQAAAGNPVLLFTFEMCKVQLAYWFGSSSEAESALKQINAVAGPAVRNHFNFMIWQFMGALVYSDRYLSTSQRKYLQGARKYTRALQALRKVGCPNLAPFLKFLSAEKLAIERVAAEKNKAAVVTAYSFAIREMRMQGWVHLEGLANERCGFFLANGGYMSEAESCFDRALELYKCKWESEAKYEWLKDKAAEILGKTSAVSRNADISLVGNIIQMYDDEENLTVKTP